MRSTRALSSTPPSSTLCAPCWPIWCRRHRLRRIAFSIETVSETDLADLLPLMRGYCDFYEVEPPDDALLAMSRELIGDAECEGLQLIARDEEGRAVGFATIFWTWSTLSASRIGVMNDLFVSAGSRGSGLADALIAECVERCRARGATSLGWQTAKDNHRAQAVYERVGGKREEWLDYSIDVPQPAR